MMVVYFSKHNQQLANLVSKHLFLIATNLYVGIITRRIAEAIRFDLTNSYSDIEIIICYQNAMATAGFEKCRIQEGKCEFVEDLDGIFMPFIPQIKIKDGIKILPPLRGNN